MAVSRRHSAISTRTPFGSIEAAEAIKYIIGKGELLTGKLLTADALTMTFRKIDVPRDPDCPACGGLQE